MTRAIFLLSLLLLTPLHSLQATPQVDEWNFKVYLDDTPVGYHRFTLTETAAGRELRSEARFDVKLLMFTAYSYRHKATESWRGDCLTGLEASTDDNGDSTAVRGVLETGRFRLTTNRTQIDLPACVMTFAYWHPDMIAQKRLLNPQTGEYTAVTISSQGEEKIAVKGVERAARRYRLDAGKVQIDLWYGTEDRRWLALDSTLNNGRKLRYRIE
jgi:hypothetical protein